MKPKLLLCLALVLSGGWFGSASAAESTNVATATHPLTLADKLKANMVKAVWTPVTSTFFSATGSVVAMQNAKRGVYEGHYESGEVWKESAIAFVNPHNQRAYVFSGIMSFFVETDSEVMGVFLSGDCLYWYSCGATDTNGIEPATAKYEQKTPSDSLVHQTCMDFSVEFRLALGSGAGAPDIVKISGTDGILQLDLRPRGETIYASVWIDLKTRKVVKYAENGKLLFPKPPEFLAGSMARFVYVSIPCLLLIIYGSYRWWIHKSASRPKQAGNPNAP